MSAVKPSPEVKKAIGEFVRVQREKYGDAALLKNGDQKIEIALLIRRANTLMQDTTGRAIPRRSDDQ